MINSVSGPASYSTQIESAPFNIAQCVREVYALLLSSLRDRDRTIQTWRDLENRSHDEFTNAKVKSLQSTIPQIMRIATVILGGVSVCGGLFPEAVKHSHDWLARNFSIPTSYMDELFATGKTDSYTKLSKMFVGTVSGIRDMVKTCIDVQDINEKAYQAELEALIEKSRRAEERRKEESSERQNASNETQRLLREIDSHIAEAIRAMAR